MAYFIFSQAKRPYDDWDLLESIDRADVAKEAFRNYQQLLKGQDETKIVMVEAYSAKEGLAKIDQAA